MDFLKKIYHMPITRMILGAFLVYNGAMHVMSYFTSSVKNTFHSIYQLAAGSIMVLAGVYFFMVAAECNCQQGTAATKNAV